MCRVPTPERLTIKKTDFPETNAIEKRQLASLEEKSPRRVILGLDIGSTTTKYALIDEAHAIWWVKITCPPKESPSR
jgi:activator of 2-hydroxyglutaryl-CoA dehydratase